MTSVSLSDHELPQIFQAADAASSEGQRRYLRLTRIRLGLVVAAATCGISSWRVGAGEVDVLGLLSLTLFIFTLVVEAELWRDHPERRWYDGRALAESIKTLAWKYSVGADPFPVNATSADQEFLARSAALKTLYVDLQLTPIIADAVTTAMRTTRTLPLTQRRAIYITGRIENQQKWYKKNSEKNLAAARRAKRALVSLETLGATCALIEAVTQFGLLFSPALAAAVGAIVAWLETKQHDQLARAYATAVSDLSSARAKLNSAVSEDAWAIEVGDAEAAISREHTRWLGSRSTNR